MNTWKTFNKYVDFHKKGLDLGLEPYTIGEPEETFIEKLDNTFAHGKVFDINEDVKDLLLRTKGTKEIDKVPFESIFIDTDFDVSEFKEKQDNDDITSVAGLLVSVANKVEIIENKEYVKNSTLDLKTLRGAEGFKIYWLGLDKGKIGYCFHTINIVNKNNLDMEFEISSKTPKIRKFLINFVSNFLNLLNNPQPDIVITERKANEAKNKRLIRHGQIPMPTKSVVLMIGKLKIYLDQLRSNGYMSYSHKFWVRGHWRTLRDEDRWGEKVGTKLWIHPFVKGSGILIDKKYNVTKEAEA